MMSIKTLLVNSNVNRKYLKYVYLKIYFPIQKDEYSEIQIRMNDEIHKYYKEVDIPGELIKDRCTADKDFVAVKQDLMDLFYYHNQYPTDENLRCIAKLWIIKI